MRYIGRISYSLYIWQQPFFNHFDPAGPRSLRSHPLLCGCMAFVCAVASYHLLEQPFIRLGHRIAKRFDEDPLSPVPSQVYTV